MEQYIFGTCSAQPLESERARLLAVSTPFVTDDIEKRIDPGKSLTGAKSVIVLGKRYEPSPYTNMSSLGYCPDYHPILKGILKKLAAQLNCNSVIMVDSGPLVERAFAVKAGIGFWGKNGMVISPVLGSFFNIGLLIVDIPLAPTPAIEASCPEDCQLCIEACPNGAIKPYSVNPALCISYLTQKKGGPSNEEKALIKNQLYGCDLCQTCCPMNSVKNKKKLFDVLDITDENFLARFNETSAAWRGLAHLKRNAEIVIENTKKGDNNGILEYTRPAGQRF